MSGVIYGLYDPRPHGPPRIRYVGYTSKRPERRLLEHILGARDRDRTHCQKWIRSLAADGFRPSLMILEQVGEGWGAREAWWIARLRSGGLTNATAGGEGLIEPSPEVRAEISAKVSASLIGNQRLLGHVHTEESKQKIGDTIRNSVKFREAMERRRGRPGPPVSAEARQKISEANRGRVHPERSPEWRQKQRDSHLGKTHSDETRAMIGASQIGNQKALGFKHSSEARSAIAASKTGTMWVNDGSRQRQMPRDEPIPEGWAAGRLKREGRA